MALSSFLGHRGSLWDVCDPMEVMVTLLDNAPETLQTRKAHSMASANVDWKETATEHVFKADLPGLRKEDVRVQVHGDRTLSISGEREQEQVQKTDTWHRVERSSGHFMRQFRLPENANLDGVSAKVDSGVLTVLVPKLEKQKPQTRRIEIAGHEETVSAASDDKAERDQSSPAV